MTIGKVLRVLVKLILILIIFGILSFGFIYLRYNEDLPVGTQNEAADQLANKMLDALDHEAFDNTSYLEWTFKNKNHYKWNRTGGTCDVIWKDFKVTLSFNEGINHKAYVHNFEVYDAQANNLMKTALKKFNNDSFWLIAPYKIFDPGTERRLVKLDNGEDAVLVTYTSGGSTPGDSYLWLLEPSGKPYAFKMWASSLPVKGLKASWNEWIVARSGATLPTKHRILFLNLDMGEVKGIN